MSYTLTLHEAAHQDILEAYDYYEHQQTGLGERFLSALDDRFAAIIEHPQYYSYIDDRKFLRDVLSIISLT